MAVDMPPGGAYASAADIEAWMDRQAPFVAVVNAAMVAAGLGDPDQRFGPTFVRAGKHAAHMRLGAAWTRPMRAGIRAHLFGRHIRLLVWNSEWRRIAIDSMDVDWRHFADDLWQAMLLASIPAETELPYLKDLDGNLRSWCRLGCDLHVGVQGRLHCSCRI